MTGACFLGVCTLQTQHLLRTETKALQQQQHNSTRLKLGTKRYIRRLFTHHSSLISNLTGVRKQLAMCLHQSLVNCARTAWLQKPSISAQLVELCCIDVLYTGPNLPTLTNRKPAVCLEHSFEKLIGWGIHGNDRDLTSGGYSPVPGSFSIVPAETTGLPSAQDQAKEPW